MIENEQYILRPDLLKSMESFQRKTSMIWKQDTEILKFVVKTEKKIHWILYFGSQKRKENLHGNLHGEKDVQGGILSALKCLKSTLVIPLIFMLVEKI